MKLPRDLRGKDLAETLCRDSGYGIVHQEGSQIVLQTEAPSHQRLTIPNHNPVRLGTLNSILRLLAHRKGVEREDILRSTEPPSF